MDDYLKNILLNLVGGKIEAIGEDNSDPYETFFALMIRKDGNLFQATILRDAEGNGAGFLDVILVR